MNIRILISDDHRVFIDGMRALLKEVPGLEVVADAENGEEMIAQVALHRPDVVLTDIHMPVMNGIEASKEILKQFPETKIIALTMMNESPYIKKMLELGACGYILKTVDKAELVRVINKVATGEKHFSQEITSTLMNDFSGRSTIPQNPVNSLTRREKEVLLLIAQGLTDKEIAERVFLSPLTVVSHRKNLLSKLGMKNKVELTRFAFDHQLVS
jgi:DNA-binding NarL/FixJ family response regulator